MDNLSLASIIEKTLKDSRLLALALTGSRALGLNDKNSDYDIIAVLEGDINPNYQDFEHEGEQIDILVIGEKQFEDEINKDTSPFHVSPKLIHAPYQSIVGQEYLADQESLARAKLIKEFVSTLPKGRVVKINPKRITEWPLIKQALTWPAHTYRISRIANSPTDLLEEINEKNIQALNGLGYTQDREGNYVLINQSNPRKEIQQGSFMKRVMLQSVNYLNELSLQKLFYGGSFVALQAPERIYNRLFPTAQFRDEGDHLIYEAPTLKQFSDSRRVFQPLSQLAKTVQGKLWDVC
jgi:hypothetical protein